MESRNSDVFLLTCSVDLPARSLVLNMKQYNGRYGCSFCYDEGKPNQAHPFIGFGHHTQFFHHSVRDNALEVMTSNTPVIICNVHVVVQLLGAQLYIVQFCYMVGKILTLATSPCLL